MQKHLLCLCAFFIIFPCAALHAEEPEEDDIIIKTIRAHLQAREAEEQRQFDNWKDESVIINNTINEELQRIIRRHLNGIPAWFHVEDYDLPATYTKEVEATIRYFSGAGRGFFNKWLKRSIEFRPIIEPILEKNGVPKDLFFLSMIESGLSMKAYSHVGAAGPWQFMPNTGRHYKLRVDNDVDERMDLIKSTEAAAKYLKNLYKMFGDWNLAMASYNAGEGRVAGAIKRCGTNDYWELIASDKCLPVETMNYVPKVLAAAIIYKNADKYGFEIPKPIYVEPLKFVIMPHDLTFSQIAAQTGVPLTEVVRYNYALRQLKTPNTGTFKFYVKSSLAPKIERAQQKLVKLSAQNKVKAQALIAAKNAPKVHTVKSGDTLWAIAVKYGCKTAEIIKLNGIKNNSIRVGMKLKLPSSAKVSGGKAVAVADNKTGAKAKNTPAPAAPKATVASAKAANKATKTATPAKKTAAPAKKAVASRNNRKTKSGKNITMVKVQAGDSLWKVANKYGMTVSELVSMNKNIDTKKALKAGTLLAVVDDN